MSPVEPSPLCWSGGIQALGDAAKALREGPDVGLAAALCPESHAGLQASKWRPLPPGQPDGHGSGHFWLWQCVGIRVGGPASSRSWNNPASASSPVRAGLKMATRFSVASPMRHGDPLLPGPGCWQLGPAGAGMELPALLVGPVASESYLLCLWHQLASWSRGRVCATRVGTRGLPLGMFSLLMPPPPLALWACWALSGHEAVLKHPPGSPGSSRPRMSRCPGCPPPTSQSSPTGRPMGQGGRPSHGHCTPSPLPERRAALPALPPGWQLVAHPERGQPGGHLLSAWPHEGLKERLGQTGWPHGCGPDTCSRVR